MPKELLFHALVHRVGKDRLLKISYDIVSYRKKEGRLRNHWRNGTSGRGLERERGREREKLANRTGQI
jgi:hypothetical protein